MIYDIINNIFYVCIPGWVSGSRDLEAPERNCWRRERERLAKKTIKKRNLF